VSEEKTLRLMFAAVVTAFVYFCSFALCVLLSMPHGKKQTKKTLLLFTAGHRVCGIVDQAKSHRLASVLLSAIESRELSKITLPNTHNSKCID